MKQSFILYLAINKLYEGLELFQKERVETFD